MAEPVSTGVLVAKIGTALLTNDKTRKGIGWIIAGILSPIIVIIALILGILTGGSSHNQATLDASFSNLPIGNLPVEYQQSIIDMRYIFLQIDTEVNSLSLENLSLDSLYIKAVFYAIFYDDVNFSTINPADFVSCFYTENEELELISITNTEEILQNISSKFGVLISLEDIRNIDEIYLTQELGAVFELPSEPPYVDENGYAEPVSDWQNNVTSEFGNRIHPIYETPSMHYGIDFGKPQGTQIFAMLDGTVTVSQFNKSYGYYIKIAHADGFETLYAHCSRVYVDVGDEVSAGEKIGLVGSTGDSTGPHLHFETIQNGEYINPRAYLPMQ